MIKKYVLHKGVFITMKHYIQTRLLHLIPILIGITFLSFALMHTASTDTVDLLYEQNGGASPAAITAHKIALGLNKDFLGQYSDWICNILQGNMGTSFVSGQPVSSVIIEKIPATIELMVIAVLITLFISIPLGMVTAVKKGSWMDYMIRFSAFTGNALPDFFIGLLLLYFFAVKIPVFSFLNTDSNTAPILPALTLAIAMSAKYTRQIRGILLEELHKPYIQAARIRGVPYFYILTHYVLRSVLAPLLALLGVSVGSLLGGAAIVESIFLWDGIGKLAVDAIVMRDYPIIQAYVIWMSLIYVLINLAVDILCCFIDPRITIHEEGH